MPKQIDGTALAAAVIASAFGFTLLTGPFLWLGSIAGLTLALVLFAFDREGYRSVVESLAYGAALSLALVLAAATPMLWLNARNGQPAAFAGPIASEWLPLVWVGITILLWVIDRTRMSGRIQYGTTVQAPSFSFRPVPAGVKELPRKAEPEAVPPPPPPTPRPTFTQPSFSYVPPEPASAAAPEPELAPALTVVEPPPAPAPLPQAIPIPAGKEATIYVTLVGEGLNVLRAVRAEHVGRDFYKIAEPMPEGEVWQFGLGQVVRCRKKNLSSGKAMVAVEEAPRAS